MPHEWVATDRTFAKSRNLAVIGQCPELALIGITPDSTTNAAPTARTLPIPAAVHQGCLTTKRTMAPRMGSIGGRAAAWRAREVPSSHPKTSATIAAMACAKAFTMAAHAALLRLRKT